MVEQTSAPVRRYERDCFSPTRLEDRGASMTRVLKSPRADIPRYCFAPVTVTLRQLRFFSAPAPTSMTEGRMALVSSSLQHIAGMSNSLSIY